MGDRIFPYKRLIALIKKLCPIAIHTHTEIPDLSLYWTCLLAPRIMQDIKIVRTSHNRVLWNKWEEYRKSCREVYAKSFMRQI